MGMRMELAEAEKKAMSKKNSTEHFLIVTMLMVIKSRAFYSLTQRGGYPRKDRTGQTFGSALRTLRLRVSDYPKLCGLSALATNPASATRNSGHCEFSPIRVV